MQFIIFFIILLFIIKKINAAKDNFYTIKSFFNEKICNTIDAISDTICNYKL